MEMMSEKPKAPPPVVAFFLTGITLVLFTLAVCVCYVLALAWHLFVSPFRAFVSMGDYMGAFSERLAWRLGNRPRQPTKREWEDKNLSPPPRRSYAEAMGYKPNALCPDKVEQPEPKIACDDCANNSTYGGVCHLHGNPPPNLETCFTRRTSNA